MNCFLQHFIEGEIKGRIKVTSRRGRRRKKLLYELKGKRGCCKLKEEAPDRTMCKNRVARGCGPVVRQTAECVNEYEVILMLMVLCHRAIYGSCRCTEAFVACALGDGESSVTEIGSYKVPTAVICPSVFPT